MWELSLRSEIWWLEKKGEFVFLEQLIGLNFYKGLDFPQLTANKTHVGVKVYLSTQEGGLVK